MPTVVDKKNKVFGKIAAARTLTEGMPQLKLSSSMPSINNNGDSVSFLTDLIKVLVGFDILVGSVVDILTHALPEIEREVKKALKMELKGIVNCGVDPHLPTWFQSTGTGVFVEINKIDFIDQLRIDPTSIGGSLLYNNIPPQLASSDFNTFLFYVIQDATVTHSWKNIIDITFFPVGSGNRPNNSLVLKANASYNNKTLTDFNNNFIDSLILFEIPNVLNGIIDILFGSIAISVGKSLRQLEGEARVNDIVDRFVNNNNEYAITDNYFAFNNEETYEQQVRATNRKRGVNQVNVSTQINTNVPTSSLVTFNDEYSIASSTLEKKGVIANNINRMADRTTINSYTSVDNSSIKLNFVQQIITNLIKSIVRVVLSPKVILIFLINYKFVYGQNATYGDAVDFMKKNKNLFHGIIKRITESIIRQLLIIAMKRIAELIAAVVIEKEIERGKNQLAQMLSLVGVSTEVLRLIKDL